jgi:hypothetical protein
MLCNRVSQKLIRNGLDKCFSGRVSASLDYVDSCCSFRQIVPG